MARDVVLFLHGRGLGPESASSVAVAFPNTDFLAPAGTVDLRRGQTWFQNERIGVAQPESVAAAEAAFLPWYEQHVPRGRRVWLCGFSNGGAFAAHFLLRHPQLFAGAALLCAPMVLPPWPEDGMRGKTVLYAHGDAQDAVVPQGFYETAEAYLLKASGANTTIQQYSAGHVISEDMVIGLAGWFSQVVAQAV